jgi:hypothetical protein
VTPWQQQQQAMLDTISRGAGELAKADWLKVRARLFRQHAGELKTKRQVLDSLRRSYETLRAKYLKVTGTTYDGWKQHGPQPEWDEVVAAAHDDAVWDRLVLRVTGGDV